MQNGEYVIIGSPIYRGGAFVIDRFLENQREIQKNYSSSELILATEQRDYIEELKDILKRYGVRGQVILFEVAKPDYACAQNWHTTCGREAIRRYIVSETKASYLLFIDSDMTCDPSVIDILKREIKGYDIVASGYPGRVYGMQTGGVGCTLFTLNALKNMTFRCCEFKNHRVIDEGEMLDVDIFDRRLRFKHGYFLAINHYNTDGNFRHIEPQPESFFRKAANARLLRYMLVKASVKCGYNIPNELYKLRSRFIRHH